MHLLWVHLSTIFSLKLYCPDSGVEVWSDNSAHHGVVYDIKWSKDDHYLLTCSGDGTCKLWHVHSISHQHNSALNIILAQQHGSFGEPGTNADRVGRPTAQVLTQI